MSAETSAVSTGVPEAEVAKAGEMLRDQVILVLSPQAWGEMLLSKHHYALELARRGNTVYFLNPPDNYRWNWKRPAARIRLRPSGMHERLILIDQELFFPYALKFHGRPLFAFGMRRQVRDILTRIPGRIDLIWSFDLGNLYPFGLFGAGPVRVFHPVDEPADAIAIAAAGGADILFSVTREILGKYSSLEIPAFFINHGLAEEFLTASAGAPEHTGGIIRAGMSGNMLRPDLDRRTLLQIVRENPDTEFHFFGSYEAAQSNIGAASGSQVTTFIASLRALPNVRLHGVLDSEALARALNRMDMLLICYDLALDQSKGTNYHKVMEYLSTGKVIVSNNISTYRGNPELVCMIPGRHGNDGLPELFRDIRTNLDKWNAPERVNLRKQFAAANTYRRQLDLIGGHLATLETGIRSGRQKAAAPR